MTTLTLPPQTVARFWAKVDMTLWCWEWAGARNGRGYGSFGYGGRTHLAHRVSFEMHKRLLLPEETVDHLCFVHECVNPEHLDACSLAENSHRAHVAGRIPYVKRDTCRRGHPLTPGNLKVDPDGGRTCRECTRARDRQRYARRMQDPELRQKYRDYMREYMRARAAAGAA